MTPRFRGIQRIHFVGIGGSGMSGLAELLLGQGYTVSGSDLAEGSAVARLRGLGVRVHTGHHAEAASDADVVVVSSAIRPGNPEVEEARRRGVPVIPRAEMLAEVMRLKHGIAVAGTHGKTTTTSLVAHLLDAAGLDPTAVVGGRVIGRGPERTGTRLGAGPLLVAEADESDGSFLRLHPVIAVVTNIEPEHLDYWGDEEALRRAFARFAGSVPFWGLAVLCLDHPGVQAILPEVGRRKTTYGLSAQAELTATALRPDGEGTRFEVRRGGARLGDVRLPLVGRHNVQNALAAVAVALELDVPFPRVAEGLAAFAGVERRFETRGVARGVRVVDDYGHHPTEIRATLAAAREMHPGRLVVVFQPHRYTRTRDLWADFAAAFHEADLLLVTDVYAAGEPKIPGVESAALVEAIAARGHRAARHVADLARVPEALVPELREGDLVLTLGAGSVTGLGPRLLEALEAES
jgi:UDP-N-acetylmuramate--alanine ligase